ncbi:helix-turn-helix domain-containing protein [Curtobacterium sp. UNCCL17]|uniref:helix-turn-helix domain-containing protein n=1 Tax=Curtobacterium sp. UNCCL17 TaxID=1449051 RepID=UPI00069231B8|nr:helix-turn-helix transcriptional regulator [Curtobacterium sp. UNCCL17]
MTQRPSHDIGARVARYRKMAGLSARELSDKLGGEMSRGVIANIENGRKTDVTVDQLLALSWALDVPPVVLALPVEEPNRMLAVIAGDDLLESVRSSDLVDWFMAKQYVSPLRDATGPGRGYAQSLLIAVEEYEASKNRLTSREQQLEDGEIDRAAVDQAHDDQARVLRRLRDLGVDLAEYRADD